MKNLTTTVISNIMRSDFDFFLMMIFVSSVFKRGSGGPRSPQLLLIFRMLQLVKAGTGQQVTSLSKVVSQYTKCFYVIRNDVGCCIPIIRIFDLILVQFCYIMSAWRRTLNPWYFWRATSTSSRRSTRLRRRRRRKTKQLSVIISHECNNRLTNRKFIREKEHI